MTEARRSKATSSTKNVQTLSVKELETQKHVLATPGMQLLVTGAKGWKPEPKGLPPMTFKAKAQNILMLVDEAVNRYTTWTVKFSNSRRSFPVRIEIQPEVPQKAPSLGKAWTDGGGQVFELFR